MVEHEKQIDLIFHALSDETRRKILMRVKDEEYSVSELAEPFAMSLAAVSKHLKVLERAGLIQRTRQGKIHWCGMVRDPLFVAKDLLNTYL